MLVGDQASDLRRADVRGIDDVASLVKPGPGALVGGKVVKTPLERVGEGGVLFLIPLDALDESVVVRVEDDVVDLDTSLLQSGADLCPVLLDEHRLDDHENPAEVLEEL